MRRIASALFFTALGLVLSLSMVSAENISSIAAHGESNLTVSFAVIGGTKSKKDAILVNLDGGHRRGADGAYRQTLEPSVNVNKVLHICVTVLEPTDRFGQGVCLTRKQLKKLGIQDGAIHIEIGHEQAKLP